MRVKGLVLFITLAVIVLVVLSVSCDGILPGSNPGGETPPPDDNAAAPAGERPRPYTRTNILLLGVDSQRGGHRTDTMMLLSVDGKDAALVSIPRDSRVAIEGHGLDKINHAYAFGREALAMQTVEDLLGIPVNYYALVNFEGFKNIVDIVGGVEMEIEEAMLADPARGFTRSGLQPLNGAQALEYVRFRRDAQGDIGRVQRQQQLIKAIGRAVKSFSTLPHIPELLRELDTNFQTDIPLVLMARLATTLWGADPGDVRTGVIPGENVRIDGLWYWQIDEAAMEDLLVDLGIKY